LYLRTLEGREKALGREHLHTLDSAYWLSVTLALQSIKLRDQGVAYQGKYEEAEAMARRALDGKEKTLGRKHQDTLTVAAGLARVLYCCGKYEVAEGIARWAQEGTEKTLGKRHPHTLERAKLLALVVREQG
jgi:hypothetical protein